MVTALMRHVYWRLPYELRRSLFRVCRPGFHRRLEQLRAVEHASPDDGSLKPFDCYRCIFVHIPKCAGVSICRSLFGNLGGSHRTIRDYQLVFSREEFRTYFKFTFVRNPWDRLVSAYSFLKAGGRNSDDEEWAAANLGDYPDFDSFVRNWVNRENVRTWIHFVPQHEFVCMPMDLVPAVDFVGHVETIERDFGYVQKKLGIRDASLSRENKTQSRRSDYRSYYVAATARIVANVYSEDIEAFGYDFDNPSSGLARGKEV